MAKNTGKGSRKGRTQTYNTKTDTWTKRDSSTGRFIDGKTSSSTPFKGVTKEN
ncbi:MAG: hypothetical protein ACLU4S_02560 [Clostridium perfringens]